MTGPKSLDLGRATKADLPSVRHVNAAAYAVNSDRMDRPPAPVLHDYQAEVAAGAVWVLGDPVVAVEPARQGTGIGRRLMEFAEQQAVARGFRQTRLYTNEVMIENLAFYHKLGYREHARRTTTATAGCS